MPARLVFSATDKLLVLMTGVRLLSYQTKPSGPKPPLVPVLEVMSPLTAFQAEPVHSTKFTSCRLS